MTLEDAITETKATHERRKQYGHDQDALDAAAKAGFANGAFEESADEIPAVLDEFYSASGEEKAASSTNTNSGGLQGKLDAQAGR